MRTITLKNIVMGLIVTILVGCANNPERKEGITEQDVYELAKRNLDGRNWSAAIQNLQLLEENFPFGNYAEQAQLELIYSYYQAQDYADVIANADRFIRLHPQHRNVDYAYYMRGLASFYQDGNTMAAMFGADTADRDRGTLQESFDYLSQFVRRFADSPYAKDAQQRLVYVRNLLARSEINIANYYFKRGAWLAAAKRGDYVVENFPETPAVPDGLAVMAQAYYLLDLPELAEKATNILAHNFPDHPALEADGTFDQKYYARRRPKNWFSYMTFGVFDRVEPPGFDSRELYNTVHISREAPAPN